MNLLKNHESKNAVLLHKLKFVMLESLKKRVNGG